MEIVLLCYALTVLVPILGSIFLGIYQQNKKRRRLLMAMWKVVGRK